MEARSFVRWIAQGYNLSFWEILRMLAQDSPRFDSFNMSFWVFCIHFWSDKDFERVSMYSDNPENSLQDENFLMIWSFLFGI